MHLANQHHQRFRITFCRESFIACNVLLTYLLSGLIIIIITVTAPTTPPFTKTQKEGNINFYCSPESSSGQLPHRLVCPSPCGYGHFNGIVAVYSLIPYSELNSPGTVTLTFHWSLSLLHSLIRSFVRSRPPWASTIMMRTMMMVDIIQLCIRVLLVGWMKPETNYMAVYFSQPRPTRDQI